MPITEEELAARLEKLKAAYGSKLADRIRDIYRAVAPLVAGEWSAQDAAQACRVAHNLAGTAETFGYMLVGDAARELEVRLTAARNDGSTALSEHTSPLREGLRALLTAGRMAGLDVPTLEA